MQRPPLTSGSWLLFASDAGGVRDAKRISTKGSSQNGFRYLSAVFVAKLYLVISPRVAAKHGTYIFGGLFELLNDHSEDLSCDLMPTRVIASPSNLIVTGASTPRKGGRI